LLNISTIEVGMATVNFSVPDEVKAAFDKAFGDQNKSSVIAELMRRAVREQQLQIRRERLLRQFSAARGSRPTFTSDEVRRARVAERP
jgi:Arc/MetJ family transcription regulator